MTGKLTRFLSYIWVVSFHSYSLIVQKQRILGPVQLKFPKTMQALGK